MSDLNDEEREKLKEMMDTWEHARIAIKFLYGLGTLLKWIIGLLGGVALIWSVLHGGSPK